MFAIVVVVVVVMVMMRVRMRMLLAGCTFTADDGDESGQGAAAAEKPMAAQRRWIARCQMVSEAEPRRSRVGRNRRDEEESWRC